MGLAGPRYCQPDAYAAFAAAISRVDDLEGLLDAAVALSRHAMADLDGSETRHRIDRLVERVARRAVGASPAARLAHLHQVLFDEEGFQGNVLDYYDVRNSFLPFVLETRLGIPISLCLVYRAVAAGVGLPVEGIAAPGHFLARVTADGGRLYVDPFAGGRVLTLEEAFDRIDEATGLEVPRAEHLLPIATNRTWLARMLRNLEAVFGATGRPADQAAMQELRDLL